jgi:hypothetical protein
MPPDDPKKEFWITIAGPGVNIIMGLAMLPLAFLWFPMIYPACINIGVGVFNLLPAFPMDGGRLLRCFLTFWHNGDYVKATRWATTVGNGFAAVLAVVGISMGYFMWVLMAVFIYLAAWAERRNTENHSIKMQANMILDTYKDQPEVARTLLRELASNVNDPAMAQAVKNAAEEIGKPVPGL